jgi:hypothetical protein
MVADIFGGSDPGIDRGGSVHLQQVDLSRLCCWN